MRTCNYQWSHSDEQPKCWIKWLRCCWNSQNKLGYVFEFMLFFRKIRYHYYLADTLLIFLHFSYLICCINKWCLCSIIYQLLPFYFICFSSLKPTPNGTMCYLQCNLSVAHDIICIWIEFSEKIKLQFWCYSHHFLNKAIANCCNKEKGKTRLQETFNLTIHQNVFRYTTNGVSSAIFVYKICATWLKYCVCQYTLCAGNPSAYS